MGVNGTRKPPPPRPSKPRVSPWGLLRLEASAMDALCVAGSVKLAADMLHRGTTTVSLRVASAHAKIGGRTRLLSIFAWRDWRQDNDWSAGDAAEP